VVYQLRPKDQSAWCEKWRWRWRRRKASTARHHTAPRRPDPDPSDQPNKVCTQHTYIHPSIHTQQHTENTPARTGCVMWFQRRLLAVGSRDSLRR
jgi:hypothetical protein